VNMQFAKQATKIFVLVSSEYLIAENQYVMGKERFFNRRHIARGELSKVSAQDFGTEGGGNRGDFHDDCAWCSNRG